MKTIIICVLILLFLMRIVDTKTQLSVENYNQKFEKEYAANEKLFSNKKLFLTTLMLENIIWTITYSYVLFCNFDILLNILSVIQIITLLFTIHYGIEDCIEKDNVVSTYHQTHMIFNVCLDYIYYPIAIVALVFLK